MDSPGFSVRRKLLLLLAGVMIPLFGIVIVALNGLSEYQQSALARLTTHSLLADVGARLHAERDRLDLAARSLAGRDEIIAALTELAGAPPAANRTAQKRALAVQLDGFTSGTGFGEADLFDQAGRLVAFSRHGGKTRILGYGTWQECRPLLFGAQASGEWQETDRPPGMHTLIEDFGTPSAPLGRMLRREDRLVTETIVPLLITGEGKPRRIGWLRLANEVAPLADLARQRGVRLLILYGNRFDHANPLGLRPSQLEQSWPLLADSPPSTARIEPVPRPGFDSAVLTLDGGENVWFVAWLEPAAGLGQPAWLGKALGAIGLAMLVILALAFRVGQRWFAHPLAALREGIQAIVSGKFDRPVTLKSDDEFALAGQDLDRLSQTLQERATRLRDIEERWQFALEGSGHGVWDLDAATGEIIFSPAWQRLFGYSPDEFPHTLASWRALVHPDDRQAVRTAFESLLQGTRSTGRIVYRWQAKSGEYRWVMSAGRLQRDAQGKPRRVIGTCTDVTAQRKLQEKLKELMGALKTSEAHFRHFFDEAGAAMLLIDPADGRIIDANAAACAFYGYTRPDLLALRITDINQMTQEEAMAEMAQALASGREQAIQPHCLKNGEVRTVEVYSSPYQFDQRLVIYAIIHDISARVAAERELREAATVFDTTTEAIMITDGNGVIKRVNQAFTDMTGYHADEVLGQTPRLLKSGRQDAQFYQGMWQRLLSQGHWEGEVWNKRKNGEIFPVWQTVSTVRDSQGKTVGFVALFSDITQKKRDEEEIAYRANYDALTALPNRNLLTERLGQALKQARREGSRVAVMFVDLDYFKQVNDTLGHAVGDRLLQLVAERMRMCVRETDTIARLGGDEFVILLMDIDAIAPAGSVAEKIIAQMAEPFVIEGNEIHIGASIGITIFPDDGRDVDTLFRNADLAMYRAKAMNRNNAQFFEPALTSAALDRRALENDLRGALARNELQIHYQPLVELASRRIGGVEALLRWQHPQRGLLASAEFVPIAEETGLIREIGNWALDESCRQLAAWEAAGHELTLALNVSARQLPEPLSVKHLLATLYKYGIAPQRLTLEITENMLLAGSSAVQQWFADAGAAGLHLAVDDFGTGYSALTYLKRYPIKRIKIDRSFVRDMAGDTTQRALIEAILAMARSLDLSVVAEGVEQSDQASLLQARACEFAQGYFFGKPQPADEFIKLLVTPSA